MHIELGARRPWIVLVVALFAAMVAGCVRPPLMSQAEVRAYGRRAYAGVDKPKVVAATKLALETLGYRVTVADPATGRIKTAPKVAVVVGTATTVGGTTSVSTSQNAIAWIVDVEAAERGARVIAVPRAYANGNPIAEHEPWDRDYAVRAFQALFDEIESNLPAGAATEARSATRAARRPHVD